MGVPSEKFDEAVRCALGDIESAEAAAEWTFGDTPALAETVLRLHVAKAALREVMERRP